MPNNIMLIITTVFVTFFVDKSFHFANSQSVLNIVDLFNNTNNNITAISDSLDLNKIGFKDVSNNCTEAFEVFTERVTNLTRCILLNARPIHICMGCKKEIDVVRNTYGKLIEEHACRKFYFESDQIGIANVIYNHVLSLWEKNKCQNCYNHVGEAEMFFQTSKDLDNCMKQYNESLTDVNNTCSMCLPYFVKINDIYKDFVKNITDENIGICMDIVDQMNVTRHTWNDLQCLSFDAYIGFPNIITVVIVGIIPVLFYLLSKNISIIEDVKLVRPKRKSYASLQDSLPKEVN